MLYQKRKKPHMLRMSTVRAQAAWPTTVLLLLLYTSAVFILSSLHTVSGRPVQLHILRQIVEECRNETNAVEADFEALMLKEVTIGRTAKCLRACLMKKINSLEIADTFNKDMVQAIAKETVAGKTQNVGNMNGIFDICIELQVSDDHCEAAEQYGKCASDHLLNTK